MIAWIFLIAILSMMLFVYLNHKQRIRREDRREKLQAKKEKFLEDLLQSNRKTENSTNDEVRDV